MTHRDQRHEKGNITPFRNQKPLHQRHRADEIDAGNENEWSPAPSGYSLDRGGSRGENGDYQHNASSDNGNGKRWDNPEDTMGISEPAEEDEEERVELTETSRFDKDQLRHKKDQDLQNHRHRTR